MESDAWGIYFFLNARERDMAAKGSFGRQKCVLCHEAYLISVLSISFISFHPSVEIFIS